MLGREFEYCIEVSARHLGEGVLELVGLVRPALTRSANDATDYFQIPTGRVVEVGTQVTI
jgi:K+ transporter